MPGKAEKARRKEALRVLREETRRVAKNHFPVGAPVLKDLLVIWVNSCQPADATTPYGSLASSSPQTTYPKERWWSGSKTKAGIVIARRSTMWKKSLIKTYAARKLRNQSANG
jgi:hypothetical protein